MVSLGVTEPRNRGRALNEVNDVIKPAWISSGNMLSEILGQFHDPVKTCPGRGILRETLGGGLCGSLPKTFSSPLPYL